MSTITKILTNWKVILFTVMVLFSIWTINPAIDKDGVAITSILDNSSSYNAGMKSPVNNVLPRNREIITTINEYEIKNLEEYYTAIDALNTEAKEYPELTITIITNKNKQGYVLSPELKLIEQNNSNLTQVIGIKDLGIRIKKAPNSNIRPGLDLEGGTRVMLEPSETIDDDTFDVLKANLQQRLNVYGLADIAISESSDLEGTRYLLVEMPGVNEEEVKELISSQGKFEAKIGNTTVFSGGDDIKAVMKTADRAGIDPQRGCGRLDDQTWICRFYFGITLSQKAAQKQADETDKLQIITIDQTTGQPLTRDNQYLSGKIDFYLDDKNTDSLNIGADLKGRAITDIQISGSKTGRTEYEARTNALKEMRRMQTLLVTGSLPTDIKIIKSDSISPVLGKTFIENIMFIGILALLGIVTVVTIRYRELLISLPIAIVMAGEVIMMLGFASIAGWNMDLAAMAAIILVIGTGVDHLIIITDETLSKSAQVLSWKEKLVRAFGIILVAGVTNIAAMLPLLSAGGGMIKGFALTSIVGVLLGIFIARPAYGAMIENLLKK